MELSTLTALPAPIKQLPIDGHTTFGSTCPNCGGDVYGIGPQCEVTICHTCFALDAGFLFAGAMAAHWLREQGLGGTIKSLQFEEMEDAKRWPAIPNTARLWYLTMEPQPTESDPDPEERELILVVQAQDGTWRTEPMSDYPTCPVHNCYTFSVRRDGLIVCPTHGPITPWGDPLNDYADDPQGYADALADWQAQEVRA